MRRFLLFLALLAVGCGGSSSRPGGPAPIFVVRRTSAEFQDVIGGFDAADEPVGVVYDERTEIAEVRTPGSVRRFSLANRDVSFGIDVDRGLASYYTFDATSTLGSLLLDTADGAIWTPRKEEEVAASDGTRLAIVDGTSNAIRDLRTETVVALPVPDGKEVGGLLGATVLLTKDEGPIPGTIIVGTGFARKAKSRTSMPSDNMIHHYAYSLQTVEGAPIAELATPSGMRYVAVQAINESGQAAGLAYPELSLDDPVLVRWDRAGVPTVLGPASDSYSEVSLAKDGRVLVRDSSRTIAIFDGDASRRVDLNLQSDDYVTFSRSGRKAAVYRYDPGVELFYDLP